MNLVEYECNAVSLLDAFDIDKARHYTETSADVFLASLIDPELLTNQERLGIIGRYTAVLEGNFIYWMTGSYLSAKTDEARSIILENLHEEIRDCHPGMMRRFAIAAQAVPTGADAAAVYHDLSNVRLFVGRLQGVPVILMMAFFEGLLQRFMPYLADLAARQGSQEMEYTDVHGVCDIAHTAGLYRALEAEIAVSPAEAASDPYEGIRLLRTLLETIVQRHDCGMQLSANKN